MTTIRLLPANPNKLQPTNQIELFPCKQISPVDYSLTRRVVKLYSETLYSIPKPIVTQWFEKYYLLYWSGNYILTTEINYGNITHLDTVYKICYRGNLTRGKIMKNNEKKYAISFRLPIPELHLPGIVLISECK